MNRKLFFDTLGWGIILWVIGYVLGIVFFFFVPPSLLGWAIMPFGLIVLFWVLIKKVGQKPFWYYWVLGVVWALIAILFDYFFLVQLLKPADGYYKLDVILYYILTFFIPIIFGWWKKQK
jgi:hypothetical protein